MRELEIELFEDEIKAFPNDPTPAIARIVENLRTEFDLYVQGLPRHTRANVVFDESIVQKMQDIAKQMRFCSKPHTVDAIERFSIVNGVAVVTDLDVLKLKEYSTVYANSDKQGRCWELMQQAADALNRLSAFWKENHGEPMVNTIENMELFRKGLLCARDGQYVPDVYMLQYLEN